MASSAEQGLPATWEPDGPAVQVVAFDGEVLTLLSPQARPPGAPVTVRIGLPIAGEVRMRGRVLACRMASGAGFETRVRTVSLRRADREAVTAALAERPQG